VNSQGFLLTPCLSKVSSLDATGLPRFLDGLEKVNPKSLGRKFRGGVNMLVKGVMPSWVRNDTETMWRGTLQRERKGRMRLRTKKSIVTVTRKISRSKKSACR